MLAEDFGYQLSPKAAKAITASIETETNKAIKESEDATARAESSRKSAGNFWVGVFALSITLALLVHNFWVFAIGLLLLTFSPGAGKSSVVAAKANEERVREMVAPVLAGRWQAWPCRMESIPGQTRRRIGLLDPEGAEAVRFVAAIPPEAWLSMTDGRGLVWFVGDMRFGGIMALPGGAPLWWTGSPLIDQKSPQPANGIQRTLEEELVKQAVKFAFDKWLQ
ncbi:hypothetical protein [Amycolatopsis sp. lyj-23]|uniref:hypothetical protein n=1 Tax=Amycolatopsis sp. lyj-23 TaxID=2789283 RepID=UPI00397BC5E9